MIHTWHVLFLTEKLERDLLLKEIAAFEIDLAIIKAGGECLSMNLHAHQHALCHGDAFGIYHQFLQDFGKGSESSMPAPEIMLMPLNAPTIAPMPLSSPACASTSFESVAPR